MRTCSLLLLALALSSLPLHSARADEAGYRQALAAAESAEQEAGALKDQWTTTTETLAAARKAAAAGDFAAATELARHAEALARASIAQARQEETAWKAAVIH